MAATYTDQQIADKLKDTIYEIVSGKRASATFGGRTWTALDLPKLEQMLRAFEQRVNAGTSAINYADFADPG